MSEYTHLVAARQLGEWTGYGVRPRGRLHEETWTIEGVRVSDGTAHITITALGNRVKVETRVMHVPADEEITIYGPRSAG